MVCETSWGLSERTKSPLFISQTNCSCACGRLVNEWYVRSCSSWKTLEYAWLTQIPKFCGQGVALDKLDIVSFSMPHRTAPRTTAVQEVSGTRSLMFLRRNEKSISCCRYLDSPNPPTRKMFWIKRLAALSSVKYPWCCSPLFASPAFQSDECALQASL